MATEFAGATDVGRKREHNEDAILLMPEQALEVVCDGMGGHEAGEVASGIGVETVKKFFELRQDPMATWPFRYDRNLDESANLLSVAAQWANQRIREAGEAEGGRKRGMGTTFVGCHLSGARATFGWVGDSRGYLWRRGELHAATSDHSLINELIKTGRMSEEEIETFAHKNVITRALGMADETQVDINTFDLEPGDICLVCCDGLTGMVEDARIAEILSEEKELQAAADRLIAEANANGGVDNITVGLARYNG
jgi:protein phosphatase